MGAGLFIVPMQESFGWTPTSLAIGLMISLLERRVAVIVSVGEKAMQIVLRSQLLRRPPRFLF